MNIAIMQGNSSYFDEVIEISLKTYAYKCAVVKQTINNGIEFIDRVQKIVTYIIKY